MHIRQFDSMSKYTLIYGLPLSKVCKEPSSFIFSPDSMLFLSKLSEFIYHNARESDFVREFSTLPIGHAMSISKNLLTNTLPMSPKSVEVYLCT